MFGKRIKYHMKISVYAIAKNEEKFARGWFDSMSEADEVVVLDTGSTDGTAKMLADLGAKVTVRQITPWRFDVARNLSLQLVSEDADLCVCADLDERFQKGWRKKLEAAFNPAAKQYRYRYTWSFNNDGSEGTVFWIDKIHTRHDFVWVHPVHEVIKYVGDLPYLAVFAEGVQLDHRPDKTKSRASYLPLLELSVKEDPTDDRNMHYLGREYMFCKRYDEAIATLKKHLALPCATWKDERCASMRFIAKCLDAQGKTSEAEQWLFNAAAEAPFLREPFIDAATHFYRLEDWHGVIFFCKKALKIEHRSLSYINEPTAWGAYPYDILSIAYFYVGDKKRALAAVDKAIEMSAEERLKNNRKLFEQ